ncbi:MAG: hypothetical protein R3293_04000 [Candidatus Promineifilaceae bacterium]|nr:hypothetical protein [Candidatus Promineifilaceae bacterium]
MKERRSSEQHDIPINYRKGNSLLGKVVLLTSSNSSTLPLLVEQLADKGAKIALICRELPASVIERIKGVRERIDGRLLIIQDVPAGAQEAAQLVDTISDQLGDLDIFIDLSVQPEQPAAASEPEGGASTQKTPHWPLMRAVLKELA